MGKRARGSGSNKFKPAEEDVIKGESDSEGEADHVTGVTEEAAAARPGKSAKVGGSGGGDSSAGGKGGEEAFRNKQRVLVIASRGIVHRFRHLMLDVCKLLPHSSKDAKMESKDRPMVINEICEMKGCNNALYFETRKHKDLYMWVAKTPLGPSAKFLVQNIHTMGELKFTGNHLMGSRPFLVFDAAFDSEPHLQLLKEMFSHTFGTPKGHRRSKPFVDHTMSFYVLDGRIWVRNYQITNKEGSSDPVLVEVGPRFCLQLHRIFAGAFQGATLYSNRDYVSPNVIRSREKVAKSLKYANRKENQKNAVMRKQLQPTLKDPLKGVFK